MCDLLEADDLKFKDDIDIETYGTWYSLDEGSITGEDLSNDPDTIRSIDNAVDIIRKCDKHLTFM